MRPFSGFVLLPGKHIFMPISLEYAALNCASMQDQFSEGEGEIQTSELRRGWRRLQTRALFRAFSEYI
jgi:hypothetical protein